MRPTAALTALLWIIVSAVVALSIAAFPTTAAAQDAKTIVEGALKAMGASNLNAIVYSGEAAYGNFGQSRTISFGLSSTSIRNYTRAIDFTKPALRETGIAVPIAGPRTPPPTGPAAAPRPFELIAPSGEGWPAQMEIWVTPWGFLKGALANNATVRSRKIDGVTYQVVTWSPAQKAPSGQPYRVIGYVNPQQIVERVETWVEHPVLGDLHVETFFTDYADFGGGLLGPAKITQRRVGMETYVALLREAHANPANLATLLTPSPTTAAPLSPPPVPITSEKLADGVYRITGGYVSLAVEFRDHVVVLEGGESEARGLAVISEVKKLFPNKRIKYVVNTHPHFDHMSGLAPFCAEGAIVLTDDNSKYFVEQALLSPRTLVGDTLARSKKKPKVESVIEKMVLQDETRTIEIHHVAGLEHSDAMLMAYLPKEKILFTADFNPPPAGQPVSPSIATLVQNIERLQLDFDRHVMVHAPDPDRPMTKADLLALVKDGRGGRSGPPEK
jgi:glyoxylase-like metal-dependent hydrolase (beta-lactamase superfamily II)